MTDEALRKAAREFLDAWDGISATLNSSAKTDPHAAHLRLNAAEAALRAALSAAPAQVGHDHSQTGVTEQDARRLRQLPAVVQRLPYPDQWGDIDWLRNAIDAAMRKEPAK